MYAYDYSEYETPLVGQGMLSWVLASASPTPEAPAHQSKTMVTGRVCKNPLALFSKGAQETLEVKLRLVPVPTVKQNEYLGSMQKYRETSNMMPQDLDAQSWTNFVRQNPGLMDGSRQPERVSSPMNQSGIERFHQFLSEGATPREFSSYHANESVRSVSPIHSFGGGPSRASTPGGSRTPMQHQQPPQQQQRQGLPSSDMIRPSSSASMRDADYQNETSHHRRDSIQSGYGSGGEDAMEPQQRKRAKLYQANWPGKSDMNIERQPSSLRVAASTAASVRIHRPTPVNPSIAAEQSQEEPIRPPTPISRPGEGPRRKRLASSSLRESSTTNNSQTSYNSPYCNSDDVPTSDQTVHSPDDGRYQGLFEQSFSMPSSPPILDSRLASKSSPVLPPISLDTDSGFMSGGVEDYMDDDATTPVEDRRRTVSRGITEENQSRSVRAPVQANSPASLISPGPENGTDANLASDVPNEQPVQKEPVRPRPSTSSGSRPSSRASTRPKPLAPAPISQTEAQRPMTGIPASDPVGPTHPPLQHAQSWAGPMSDFTIIEAEIPIPGSGRSRKAGAAKRSKQIQSRLDDAIKAGQVPPYCENCGSIETPTWRRAWSKEVIGNEWDAKEMMKDSAMLFFESMERDAQDKMIKFKIYKKTLGRDDNEWTQVLLCNPCGLWLHKLKHMRPENRWNKQPLEKNSKKKLPARNRRGGGPLSNPSTRTRSKAAPSQTAASSPAPTEASSVPADEVITPQAEDNEQDQDDDTEYPPSKRRRANSAEPPRSTETAKDRWEQDDAMEALRRAIESSPARNMETRKVPTTEPNLTPKPVRRALFPATPRGGPLKELDASFLNSCSPRRSPRIASRDDKRAPEKENQEPAPDDDLDGLFESPSMGLELPVSPTPRRRHPRVDAVQERRHSLPCSSPTNNRRKNTSAASPTRLTAERLQRIQEDHETPQSSPRQQRTPNKNGVPELPDAALHSETLESLDGIILDIFHDDPNPNEFQLENVKFQGEDWANWLPTDYVSPSASEEGPENSEDLINAILFDPANMKENLDDPQFNPFNFGDTQVPDSGFFSSDALHADQQGLSTKPQSSTDQSHDQHANSPAS